MPGTGSASEWTLLRAACSDTHNQERQDSLRSLLRSPIRWNVLLDLADRHGVQPLLSRSLSGMEMVPQEPANALKQSFQTNLHKALLLSRELIRIVDRLSALGIEVLPYKGLVLAESVYGDIALRQAGDIDLLIRPGDLPKVRQAVRELGYTPHAPLSPVHEPAYLQSGYECAFDGESGRNLLEVQWAIQPRFYAVDLDMDDLFSRSVKSTVAGYPIKTLCREDLFFVLALHAAKHVWARMIWLCDVERIMHDARLNWDLIAQQAVEFGIVRILRVTLMLVSRTFGVSVPAAAERSLPPDSVAPRLADEIENDIFGKDAFSVESLSYFRLMLRLRERSTDRIRFLSRLVLTPGPGEWAAVQLARPLHPLYRVVRLSRLAARFVRM